MNIETITAQQAQKFIMQGAQLLDIRGMDEYAHEHIAQASLLSLPDIEKGGNRRRLTRRML